MHRPQILILDEDSEMRTLLSEQLHGLDFITEQANHYQQALKKIETGSIDLLITNYKIPEVACLELVKRCRELKKGQPFAVLVISLALPPSEIEKAMAHGIDDFLNLPFDRVALLSKVKSLLKKVKPIEGTMPLQSGKRMLGEIKLDVKSFDVFCADERVHLTPNEFKLLQVLIENQGQVLSRERLIELVQGAGIAVVDRAVDTHIFSLRKKLGKCGDQIETVRGEGYRINAL